MKTNPDYELINLFMGYTFLKDHNKWYDPTYGVFVRPQYYVSLDWLMPVVHKIFDTADTDVREINKENLKIFELGLLTPIHEIYEAVLEYLKWKDK